MTDRVGQHAVPCNLPERPKQASPVFSTSDQYMIGGCAYDVAVVRYAGHLRGRDAAFGGLTPIILVIVPCLHMIFDDLLGLTADRAVN